MSDMVDTVELSMKEARTQIELMQAFERLCNNSDFNLVFSEGYFEKNASRLVLLKADPSLQSDEHQRDINKSIDAIGYLRQHLLSIRQMGRIAEKTLADDEATREALLAEELN